MKKYIMPRILKANANGTIEVSVPDTDYASVAKEKDLAKAAQQSVDNAKASEASAIGSANIAAGAATTANDANIATLGFKVAAEASKDVAGGASAAATASVWIIRGIQLVAADIGVEAWDSAVKAGYYADLARGYSKEATEAIKKAGLRVIIKQIPGIPGASGAAGVTTLLIDSNINTNNNPITNISQSPAGDYDAISSKFYWDLFNDNVELIWA